MAHSPPFAVPYKLPGGPYRISTAENEAVCGAVGAAPRHGRAHPIFFYIATQNGMGVTVGDLFDLCQFDPADGPLMVSTRAVFHQPIRTDTDYVVSGEIIGLTRKPSRTFGAADLFEFALRLATPSGDQIAECVNAWMLPRKAAS
ncbi:hypothetical protein U91I_01385 [alpha proteobacterium U9-1i]|nr:hypothetical protein U91I_01385 [alpha proteobacterium U9-1i]